MPRRFTTLLDRASRMRRLIEEEQKSQHPDAFRLIRMKNLYLRLSASLKGLNARQMIKMASAPRLKPIVVYSTVRSAPAFSRWS